MDQKLIGTVFLAALAAALLDAVEAGRIARDEMGRAAIGYGVYGVPETFIIDAGSVIRYKHVGPIQANDFAEKIAPVIERLMREGNAK